MDQMDTRFFAYLRAEEQPLSYLQIPLTSCTTEHYKHVLDRSASDKEA